MILTLSTKGKKKGRKFKYARTNGFVFSPVLRAVLWRALSEAVSDGLLNRLGEGFYDIYAEDEDNPKKKKRAVSFLLLQPSIIKP